jgi:hypothetical protein
MESTIFDLARVSLLFVFPFLLVIQLGGSVYFLIHSSREKCGISKVRFPVYLKLYTTNSDNAGNVTYSSHQCKDHLRQ